MPLKSLALLILSFLFSCTSSINDIEIEGYVNHSPTFSWVTKNDKVYSILQNHKDFKEHFYIVDKYDLWGFDYMCIDLNESGKYAVVFIPEGKEQFIKKEIFSNVNEQFIKKESYKVKISVRKLGEGFYKALSLKNISLVSRTPNMGDFSRID